MQAGKPAGRRAGRKAGGSKASGRLTVTILSMVASPLMARRFTRRLQLGHRPCSWTDCWMQGLQGVGGREGGFGWQHSSVASSSQATATPGLSPAGVADRSQLSGAIMAQ